MGILPLTHGQPSDAAQKDFLEFKTEAEKGDASAQFNLGGCYATGEGVAKDEAEAVKWFRKAADQGKLKAQVNLGFCYANGKGVAKDEVEAYARSIIAAARLPMAAEFQARLELKLSPAQREAGQKRSEELRKKIEEAQSGKIAEADGCSQQQVPLRPK